MPVRFPPGDTSDEDAEAPAPRPVLQKTGYAIPKSVAAHYVSFDGKFLDRQSEVVHFEDHGKKLTTESEDRTVITHMVEVAKAKSWGMLELNGTEEFRRQAWIAAEVAGMHRVASNPARKIARWLRQPGRRCVSARPPGRLLATLRNRVLTWKRAKTPLSRPRRIAARNRRLRNAREQQTARPRRNMRRRAVDDEMANTVAAPALGRPSQTSEGVSPRACWKTWPREIRARSEKQPQLLRDRRYGTGRADGVGPGSRACDCGEWLSAGSACEIGARRK